MLVQPLYVRIVLESIVATLGVGVYNRVTALWSVPHPEACTILSMVAAGGYDLSDGSLVVLFGCAVW